MKDFPLISAVVIHYNNGEYLYETIDSILRQNYPNIELLITDDCSNEGFDVDRVIQYINKNRHENLKRTIININSKNLGTVKNLETIRAKEHGEFELLIAGDDVWHDSDVFSAFARRFKELGPEVEWISSQMEMCDETLENVKELFVKPEVVDMIAREAYKELLSYQINTIALPSAGTALRRTFFEKIGNLSDNYDLIEDYPSQVRAMRLGIPVYYLDQVTVRHRDGGVSHGNKRNNDKIYYRYICDFKKIFEKEIFPFEKEFSDESVKRAKLRYTWYQSQFETLQKSFAPEPLQQDSPMQRDRIFKNFIRNIIPRLKLAAQIGKIKNDIIVVMILLLSLTFLRMGNSFYTSQDALIRFVTLGIWAAIAVIIFRFLLLVLVSVKSKLNLFNR